MTDGRRPRVVCVSNDVMPGSTVPVAAPGLRVFGLAAGLRRHGFDVETLVDRTVVNRIWPSPVPLPGRPGTAVIDPARVQGHLEARAPVAVVLTNSNQVRHLRPHDGVRLIYDFFAPKILELECHDAGPSSEQLHRLREEKLAGLAATDAVIVNGRKKLDYAAGWLRRAGRDPSALAVEVVTMCVPLDGFATPEGGEGPLRLGMAGYMQAWSAPGVWLDHVLPLLGDSMTLDVVAPRHWGPATALPLTEQQQRLLAHPAVTSRPALGYTDYRAFIGSLDVVIDLFDHSPERELAMVTRTVVALSCGVPVIHPPFTEVSPLVEQYDAGWLVDPVAPDRVEGVLAAVRDDRSAVTRKAANARRLAVEVIDAYVATAPLARILDADRAG